MAVRVAVAYVVNCPDNAALVQSFCNRLVDIPHIFAFPVTFSKMARFVNRMNDRKTFFFGERKVFFAIGWRKMNNAGAIFSREIIGCPYLVCVLDAIFN